jgi:hypothetical protein
VEIAEEQPTVDIETKPEPAPNFLSDRDFFRGRVQDLVEQIKSPPQPLSSEQLLVLMAEIISKLQQAAKDELSAQNAAAGSAVDSHNLYNSLELAKSILQPHQSILTTRADYRNYCSEAIKMIGTEGGLQGLVHDLQTSVELVIFGKQIPRSTFLRQFEKSLGDLFFRK